VSSLTGRNIQPVCVTYAVTRLAWRSGFSVVALHVRGVLPSALGGRTHVAFEWRRQAGPEQPRASHHSRSEALPQPVGRIHDPPPSIILRDVSEERELVGRRRAPPAGLLRQDGLTIC